MKIQVNTDNNIAGREELADKVRESVEHVLGRFSERITRVEVHLSDENGRKISADDRRCMMEARLEGRPPVAVSHQADGLMQAVDGAAEKLGRLLDSTLDRLRDESRRRTDPIPPEM